MQYVISDIETETCFRVFSEDEITFEEVIGIATMANDNLIKAGENPCFRVDVYPDNMMTFISQWEDDFFNHLVETYGELTQEEKYLLSEALDEPIQDEGNVRSLCNYRNKRK